MRTDSASRIIKAPARAVYRALLAPYAIAKWRAPEGMRCEIDVFTPLEGGTYRMRMIYVGAHKTRGKTSEHEDAVNGRFAKLEPNARVVEEITFDTADDAFAGTMTLTTALVPVLGGTRVTMAAENVPPGIKASDHRKGMESSLNNLAAFVEKTRR